MFKRSAYLEWLSDDYNKLIEALDLNDLQKHFLRSRWLDQVLWMEGRANSAKLLYYGLRLVTIIGGVLIPALINVKMTAGTVPFVTWATFVISLLVAISAGVEGFFRYGEHWRHYRMTVELLKSEGWQFFQLTDRYRRLGSHARAYPLFASRVEKITKLEVGAYITELAREKTTEEEDEATEVQARKDYGRREPSG